MVTALPIVGALIDLKCSRHIEELRSGFSYFEMPVYVVGLKAHKRPYSRIRLAGDEAQGEKSPEFLLHLWSGFDNKRANGHISELQKLVLR